MSLVFDTSVLINLERKEPKTVEAVRRLAEVDPLAPSVAFLAYFEFIHGLHAKSPKNKEQSLSFIEQFRCLEPTRRTAHILSRLLIAHALKGEGITMSDALIASQAIEHNMILVTGDKQFQKIKELKVALAY